MTPYNPTNFDLDSVPFTTAVNAIFLEPEALLQEIYNSLCKAGIPPYIAQQAAKKSITTTRNAIVDTLSLVLANQTEVESWEAE
ncbi:hypothetical protein [Kluyvera genomosp. 2]|uniref:hypothetical protein n=1 Tax=Kluyvera genomosp. 2 TaxID=2774054 RepID=UPI002FD85DEB